MTAPFRRDELVTIEQRTATRDPDFGAEVESYTLVADGVWAYVQDILPLARSDAAVHGLDVALTRARLRIPVDGRVLPGMRVTLHGRGERQMKIIAGPSLLDDRRHAEYLLEGFSS